MKYHYIRSNVRVGFESTSKLYAQCYLQYRISFLFIFNRWVTVNETYYDHRFKARSGKEWDVKEIVFCLKKEGQQFKRQKLKDRQTERDINKITKE